MKSKKLFYSGILLILIFIVALSLYINNSGKMKEIAYTDFISMVENGEIKEVKINDSSKLVVTLINNENITTDNPRIDNLKENLLLNNIKVTEETIELGKLAILGVLSVILIMIIVYSKNNSLKETEKEMNHLTKLDDLGQESSLRFTDVAGNEEAKQNLQEMIDFIREPKKYSKYGARLPRGVLLYGPPGTGKTLLAKALAGEAEASIFAVSGSDFIQVYAGLGASRIRNLFREAKEAGKSVIFIDEIDSLGKKRKGANISGNEESDRTLNALLSEMSGFKDNEGIIVIGATNRIDVLDEALLRPGRFDRQVEVQLPDINAREKILKLHCRNKPISKSVDLRRLATETIYFSGAKLENLLNESAMIAAKNDDEEIDNSHINQAYYKVLVGDEKKDKSTIADRDKEITAYHEAGHALVTKLVAKDNRVPKVSIIPSSKGIGGFSLNIPPDRAYQSKSEIEANIKILLGGRAAEEIRFGKDNITTGALSDLEKATESVISMVGLYGMDDAFGILNYNIMISRDINHSEILFQRSKEIIEALYDDTLRVLIENRIKLNNLAEKLLEKEIIDEYDVDKIVEEVIK